MVNEETTTVTEADGIGHIEGGGAPEAVVKGGSAITKRPANVRKEQKTATQTPEAAPAHPDIVDDFLAGMTGQAFDVFAAAIGDAHRIVFREIPADGVTAGDVLAAVTDMAGEVTASMSPGQSAEVATFDLVRVGGSLFIGARVRIV